jgi:Flp pilus assembly protein TadG
MADRRRSQPRSSLLRDERGVAAIEFAVILPVFLLLLFGIICYGGYFWMAHDVQQTANDAARAALAGLDATERQQLAERSVATHVADGGSLTLGKTKVRVAERDDNVIVTVSYDARGSAFWRVMSLLPMPSTTIDRTATVALGGY